MKSDIMLRFTPPTFNELWLLKGAVPMIGKNGNELKMLTFPKALGVKINTDIALLSIFTIMFADGRAMRKSEVISKAIPLIMAQFGNKDEASAERTILYGISFFKNEFSECGFTEFRLEAVA